MLHPTLPGGAIISWPFGPHEQYIVIYILVTFLYALVRATDVCALCAALTRVQRNLEIACEILDLS